MNTAPTVAFGSNNATAVSVTNDTTLTCTAPAGTGLVDVRVTTWAGQSDVSAGDQFTYQSVTPLTVTVNQAAAQADPTNASPVNFTVVFSAAVTDFVAADVTLGGTATGSKSAIVTGSGTTYNVAVSGMTGSGTVIASSAAGVAHDAGATANSASTSSDNSVTYDNVAPTVTVVQAAAQADPTNACPVNFTVTFSESVTDFVTADVTLGAPRPAQAGHRHRFRHHL